MSGLSTNYEDLDGDAKNRQARLALDVFMMLAGGDKAEPEDTTRMAIQMTSGGVEGYGDKLMSTTKTNLSKLTGMNNLKNKIDRIAGEVLRKVVEECGMEPDEYPLVEGERIVDHGFEYKTLTVVPLKERERAVEKIKDDYEGNFKCMLDLVRCSIIVKSETQLKAVMDKLLELGIVVRLKNRFANPLPTGIRDCLMNMKIGGHICEVQLHLSYIIKEKGAMHEHYNFFRDKFSGASASYTEIMKKVEALGLEGREENVEYGVSKLLKEGDLGKLRGLEDIVGKEKGFGGVKLDVVGLIMAAAMSDEERISKYRGLVKRMTTSLGEENAVAMETLHSLGVRLKKKGLYDEAREAYEKCLAGKMKVFGKKDERTLGTLNNLGNVYKKLGNYEKALEYYERTLKVKKRMSGKHHPRTLMTLGNLGELYRDATDSFKDLEKAEELLLQALKGRKHSSAMIIVKRNVCVKSIWCASK
ncbi:hypothetical protein TL16_g09972 [Triparma laevis f. inornata]|uniref:Kinesin light chain n=1 Tax=Triparma laevis f. inornata TaxID=1714386 RepID=A0A9W7ENV4_9STRA|nr:hypothetical protein TL16_g09972 [Triparma laevis f. inornata]